MCEHICEDMRKYTDICENNMQKYATMCERTANICKHMRRQYANIICEHVRKTYANTYKHMQKYLKISERIQTYTYIYKQDGEALSEGVRGGMENL